MSAKRPTIRNISYAQRRSNDVRENIDLVSLLKPSFHLAVTVVKVTDVMDL